MPDDSLHSLRESAYNATVLQLRRAHEGLMILRVELDSGPVAFEPGQYTVLGLGYWEPRLEGTQEEELDEKRRRTLARRAYSISSPLVDEAGQLVRPDTAPYLEFYVSLVKSAQVRPPALTPRLFLLQEGDRLYVGPRARGNYTLAAVSAEDDVLFAATGTGEAPHNAMIAELLSREHRGKIASIVSVRFRADLGYLGPHRALEERFTNYRYIPLTTREAENLDPLHQHYVGKRYIQDFVESEEFQRRTQMKLDPERVHVFLCGNPDMIGAPLYPPEPVRRFSVEHGMVERLERRGFVVDMPREPGNVHFEKYW